MAGGGGPRRAGDSTASFNIDSAPGRRVNKSIVPTKFRTLYDVCELVSSHKIIKTQPPVLIISKTIERLYASYSALVLLIWWMTGEITFN